MNSIFVSKLLFITALFALSLNAAQAQQGVRFGATQLSAGMHLIQAEVAANDQQRQQGLMFREKMGANEGMVFIFPSATDGCMWMKNTLLPLAVAFMDTEGVIVNIEEMKPQTTDSHCASKPIRYALEMNSGWFGKKGIKPGTRIEGLPPLR